MSHSTATAIAKAGGDTWFFITADYAYGNAIQHDGDGPGRRTRVDADRRLFTGT